MAELRAAADDASKLGVDAFAAEAEIALGTALYDGGYAVDAGEALDRARDHAERARFAIGLAEALVRRVGVAIQQGELDMALEVAKRAETALEAAGRPDRLQLLLHRFRSQVHALRNEPEPAAKDLAASATLTEAVFGGGSGGGAQAPSFQANIAAFHKY